MRTLEHSTYSIWPEWRAVSGAPSCRLVFIATNLFPKKWVQTKDDGDGYRQRERDRNRGTKHETQTWMLNHWLRFFSVVLSCHFMLMRLNSPENKMKEIMRRSFLSFLAFAHTQLRRRRQRLAVESLECVTHSTIYFYFHFMFCALFNTFVHLRVDNGSNGKWLQKKGKNARKTKRHRDK